MVERSVYHGGAEMKNIPILRADAFFENIGSPEKNDALLGQAYKVKRDVASMQHSNDGCWRARFNYDNAAWLFQKLEDSVNKALEFYLANDLTYKNRFNPQNLKLDMWTNINSPGSRNELHSHREYDLVAVYYVQATDTGGLVMYNPANLLNDCSPNSPFISKMVFQPKDGDLIIWPAWVPHEVEVNQSNKDRVCIAFNIKL